MNSVTFLKSGTCGNFSDEGDSSSFSLTYPSSFFFFTFLFVGVCATRATGNICVGGVFHVRKSLKERMMTFLCCVVLFEIISAEPTKKESEEN